MRIRHWTRYSVCGKLAQHNREFFCATPSRCHTRLLVDVVIVQCWNACCWKMVSESLMPLLLLLLFISYSHHRDGLSGWRAGVHNRSVSNANMFNTRKDWGTVLSSVSRLSDLRFIQLERLEICSVCVHIEPAHQSLCAKHITNTADIVHCIACVAVIFQELMQLALT